MAFWINFGLILIGFPHAWDNQALVVIFILYFISVGRCGDDENAGNHEICGVAGGRREQPFKKMMSTSMTLWSLLRHIVYSDCWRVFARMPLNSGLNWHPHANLWIPQHATQLALSIGYPLIWTNFPPWKKTFSSQSIIPFFNFSKQTTTNMIFNQTIHHPNNLNHQLDQPK